jgi:ABC-type lipopolysaccharide export system ATPase subunit
MATGSVALSGLSKDLLEDDRIKSLYLGGEVS